MIELCIDARMINASGIGTFLRTILEGLLEDESFKCSLLIYKKDRQDSLFKGKSLSFIELKSKIYSIKEQIELTCKIPKVDLFWSPHINVPLFPIRAKKRIVTIHDCYHLEHAKQFSFFKRVYASLIYNMAALHADQIVTVSHFSKSQIQKHCFIKKECLVVYNGIDPCRFNANIKDVSQIVEKYHLPKIFVLAVGNIKPHKNLKSLVQAFEQLKKQENHGELKLVIVGKKEGFSSQDSELFNLIFNHSFKEDILFTGHIPSDELATLYSLATVFVFPSLYEGFGFPPLEAMASDCPVIASCTASIPEICQDAVHYIKPMDPYDISKAINYLIDNSEKCEELKQRGRDRIKNFPSSLPQIAYSKIFKDLL